MTKAMRTVKKGVIPAAQVFAEARKRPGYAEAYDALEEEFSLVTALIKARTNSGLAQAELAKRMSTDPSRHRPSRSRRPTPFDTHARAPCQGDRPPPRDHASCRRTVSPGVERLDDEAPIPTLCGR